MKKFPSIHENCPKSKYTRLLLLHTLLFAVNASRTIISAFAHFLSIPLTLESILRLFAYPLSRLQSPRADTMSSQNEPHLPLARNGESPAPVTARGLSETDEQNQPGPSSISSSSQRRRAQCFSENTIPKPLSTTELLKSGFSIGEITSGLDTDLFDNIEIRFHEKQQEIEYWRGRCAALAAEVTTANQHIEWLKKQIDDTNAVAIRQSHQSAEDHKTLKEQFEVEKKTLEERVSKQKAHMTQLNIGCQQKYKEVKDLKDRMKRAEEDREKALEAYRVLVREKKEFEAKSEAETDGLVREIRELKVRLAHTQESLLGRIRELQNRPEVYTGALVRVDPVTTQSETSSQASTSSAAVRDQIIGHNETEDRILDAIAKGFPVVNLPCDHGVEVVIDRDPRFYGPQGIEEWEVDDSISVHSTRVIVQSSTHEDFATTYDYRGFIGTEGRQAADLIPRSASAPPDEGEDYYFSTAAFFTTHPSERYNEYADMPIHTLGLIPQETGSSSSVKNSVPASSYSQSADPETMCQEIQRQLTRVQQDLTISQTNEITLERQRAEMKEQMDKERAEMKEKLETLEQLLAAAQTQPAYPHQIAETSHDASAGGSTQTQIEETQFAQSQHATSSNPTRASNTLTIYIPPSHLNTTADDNTPATAGTATSTSGSQALTPATTVQTEELTQLKTELENAHARSEYYRQKYIDASAEKHRSDQRYATAAQTLDVAHTMMTAAFQEWLAWRERHMQLVETFGIMYTPETGANGEQLDALVITQNGTGRAVMPARGDRMMP